MLAAYFQIQCRRSKVDDLLQICPINLGQGGPLEFVEGPSIAEADRVKHHGFLMAFRHVRGANHAVDEVILLVDVPGQNNAQFFRRLAGKAICPQWCSFLFVRCMKFPNRPSKRHMHRMKMADLGNHKADLYQGFCQQQHPEDSYHCPLKYMPAIAKHSMMYG